MKEEINAIINRMTILDKIKKIIGEITDDHPMDVAVDQPLGEIAKNDNFIQQLVDVFSVELEKEDISQIDSVLDLCILIEKMKKKCD